MRSQQERGNLIDQLVADARPVRRLWSPSARLALWLSLAVALVLRSAYIGLRPDLGVQFQYPMFMIEVGALFAAAGLFAGLSLVAAVPARGLNTRQFILATLLGVAVWLIPLRLPAETDVPFSQFLAMALACERQTAILALLPAVTLLIALRRGAPLTGAMAGSLAGMAAFLLATGIMRLVCPSEARFHLLVGHVLPAVAGVPIAAIAGRMLFRRWRDGRVPVGR